MSCGGLKTVDRAGDHRRQAARCVAAAAATSDLHFKAVLIEMAASCLKLAEQANGNSHLDLVCETTLVPDQPDSLQPAVL